MSWPWHYLPQRPSRRPLKRLVQSLELLPHVPSPRIFAGDSSSEEEELLLPDFPVASLSLITGFLRRTLPLTPTIGIGTRSGRRRSLLLLMPSPNVANLWCPTSACTAWSWRARRNSLSADAMKGRQRRSERVRLFVSLLLIYASSQSSLWNEKRDSSESHTVTANFELSKPVTKEKDINLKSESDEQGTTVK
eukprot:scaffold2481_cov83-Skeletonema_dohrnii-CCMP3373.AAC.3